LIKTVSDSKKFSASAIQKSFCTFMKWSCGP